MRDDAFRLLNQHVKVSQETFEKLSRYHDLLVKWQTKINLVGSDTITDAWTRHFLDSLQLKNYIDDMNKPALDIGSGAGFPGMVLAICGASDMHLVESDARKTTFLEEVARVTGTKVFIYHCRIEDRPIEKAEIIVSRACSSLDQLLEYVSPYVSHETICLFPKGKNYLKEMLDAKEQWVFDETVIPSITDTQGVILKLAHVRKRGYDNY